MITQVQKSVCIRNFVYRLAALIILCVAGLFPAQATEEDLKSLMQQEDYIKASLIVVSPGKEIYSAGGHIAMRLSCPIQGVDYIYEFDAAMDDSSSVVAHYLNRTLRGEFVRLYETVFIDNVRKENRQAEEYALNLTPEQEVALWSNLDNAVDNRINYPFSPSEYNCCSTILSMIELAVEDGLFSSPEVMSSLESSGRKSIEDFFCGSPFTGLLWNILLGREFDSPKQAVNLYYPKMIGHTLSLIKNPANGKFLVSSKKGNAEFPSGGYGAFAPHTMFLLVFIAACLLTIINIKGKLRRSAQIFDCSLLTVNAAIGCVLWYMFCSSVFTEEVYVNYLMFVFTPLPIALMFIRKSNVRLWFAIILSAACVASLVGVAFVPQLQYYCLWLFVLTTLVRGLYYIYNVYKTNIKLTLKTKEL